MIDFLIAYLIIALIIFLLFEPMIKGGNMETTFFLEKYLGLSNVQLKFIGAILWLPILGIIIFKK